MKFTTGDVNCYLQVEGTVGWTGGVGTNGMGVGYHLLEWAGRVAICLEV